MENNVLFGKLPSAVTYGGLEYPIRTDYRTAIAFSELMQDREATDATKVLVANDLYYPGEMPPDEGAAFSLVYEFYIGGSQPYNGHTNRDKRELFSYVYDAPYIYAAFMAQYGIDLQAVNLHWWKFKAMFAGLNDNNEIVKIIGYRAMKISNKFSKEQKAFYRKMKRQYALPDRRTQEEKDADFAEMLW